MTLAEFKSLVEMMQNLPCVMEQLEDVQVRGCVEIFSALKLCFESVLLRLTSVLCDF